MKLSVLDQSISLAGSSEDAAIRDTLELAVHCEQLGYHRFWLSEHHSLPTIVGTAPEILMAAVAARTTRIRIGSAGVMLPHYAALKVAEQFRVLEALAPGRIDLGVGRAPGADMRTAQLLNPNAYAAAENFPQQIRDLQWWTAGEPHHGVIAHPRGPHLPQIWVLGSSDYGAQLAAHFGLPYAFAYFFTDGQGVRAGAGAVPHAVQAERAPPDAAADDLRLGAGRRHRGRGAAPCAEPRALARRPHARRARAAAGARRHRRARLHATSERPTVEATQRKALVGTAAQVGAKMRALAASLGLDELVVNTWAHDPAVRRHSYALLAREFAL